MSAALLDGNVLVALVVEDHLHHELALDWFAGWPSPFATCPITEGTLLRFLLREGVGVVEAAGVLEELRAHDRHEFWPDDLAYEATMLTSVTGHRQVTDVYLVALAQARAARLVTLDRALATMHGPAAVELLAPVAQ